MLAVPTLLELQRRFIAALYGAGDTGLAGTIADNGLESNARLRIYRRSGIQIHTEALRETYPAVLALVGEAFFDQAATRYRGLYPSRSGNLQVFGAHFGDFLDTLPELRELPYLGDVARLEWQRQAVVLAGEAEPLSPDAFDRALAKVEGAVRIALHPSVRLLTSPHPILSVWRYTQQPTAGRLTLAETGDHILLWRSDGQVAMALIDVASHACIAALAHGLTLDAAHAAACACDVAFDLAACIASVVTQGLVIAITPIQDEENSACACSGN